MKIDPEFKKWASEENSGILGGNLNGNLWVCGIEYGGEEKEPKLHQDHKIFEKNGYPCWDTGENGQDYPSVYTGCVNWGFQQKIAKIVLTMEGRPDDDYKEYIRTRLCRSDGNTFLMNLYPLRFPKSDDKYWDKKRYERTGFPNKVAYKAWCMEHRFPCFRELVEKYKPKLLLCVGSSFSADFKLAFLPEEMLFENGQELSLPSNKKYQRFEINNHKTTVLLTPFLGQGGIMSDEDLRFIGEKIV